MFEDSQGGMEKAFWDFGYKNVSRYYAMVA